MEQQISSAELAYRETIGQLSQQVANTMLERNQIYFELQKVSKELAELKKEDEEEVSND